jgi:hypothetical protein
MPYPGRPEGGAPKFRHTCAATLYMAAIERHLERAGVPCLLCHLWQESTLYSTKLLCMFRVVLCWWSVVLC